MANINLYVDDQKLRRKIEDLVQAWKNRKSYVNQLHEIQSHLIAVVQSDGSEVLTNRLGYHVVVRGVPGRDEGGGYTDLGGQRYREGETVPGESRDALAAKRMLQALDDVVLGITSLDPEDAERVARGAIALIAGLGMDAARGRKVVASASKGHAAIHGSDDQKAERWRAILRVSEEVEREHPELSVNRHNELVGQRCGVSAKTVQRTKLKRRRGKI